jgi:hypothetical protein
MTTIFSYRNLAAAADEQVFREDVSVGERISRAARHGCGGLCIGRFADAGNEWARSASGFGAPQPLPILFLTGQGDIPTSVRAMRDGAGDFGKTAPKEKLLAAVRRALDRDTRNVPRASGSANCGGASTR